MDPKYLKLKRLDIESIMYRALCSPSERLVNVFYVSLDGCQSNHSLRLLYSVNNMIL